MYITMNLFFILQLCMLTLTLCMLAFWNREGVVFFLPSLPSHLTVSHVFPLPMSGANWRSLSLLWGFPLPLPIWRPYPQGPHTLPSQGTRQVRFQEFSQNCAVPWVHLERVREQNRLRTPSPPPPHSVRNGNRNWLGSWLALSQTVNHSESELLTPSGGLK